MEDFVETGIIEEFPGEYYRPLDLQARKKILERMILLEEEGMITYRFIQGETELSHTIQLYWDTERKRLSVNQIQKDRILQIVVEEGSIYRTFQNYLEYMEKKEKIFSAQKSMEMLKELKSRYF